MRHASCNESNFACGPHGLQLSGIFICGMPAAMNLILHVALTGCSFQAFSYVALPGCFEFRLWLFSLVSCSNNFTRLYIMLIGKTTNQFDLKINMFIFFNQSCP